MSYWIAGAAAVGALADRKKPLRGAAMGAGLMATGGAAAGAFGGAGAAGAGAAGAGAAGTGTAAAGSAGAAGTAGGGLLGGAGAAGSAAPAATGGAAQSGGLLSTFNQYKPAFDAAATGVQMSGLLDPQQQQAPAPEVQQAQGGSQVMAGLASQGGSAKLQSDAAERERRKQMIRGYA